MLEKELQELKHLRFDWSDEIPNEVLHSIHAPGQESPRYKVRVAWFQVILTTVEYCEDKRWLDGTTRKMFGSFKNYMMNGYREKPRTTREDIQLGNYLLDKVIYDLER